MINPSKIKIELPAKIYAVKSQEICIFKNNLVRSFSTEFNRLIECYTTDLSLAEIKAYDEFIKITPAAVGSYNLQFRFFNEYGTEIQSKDVTLEVVDNVGLSSAATVVMCGDSITTEGYNITQTIGASFAALGGTQPDLAGSKTAGAYKNEAILGKTWSYFGTSLGPFWSGSSVDFDWYSTTYLAGATIDLISFQLGVNDSFVNSLHSEAAIDSIVDKAKYLFDRFKLHNAAGKFVIVLPSFGATSLDGFAEVYGAAFCRSHFITNLQNLISKLILEFDNGAYDANASICIGGYGFDRKDGIGLKSITNKNSRNTAQVQRQNEGVHPSDATVTGKNIADLIFPHFLKLLQ